MKRYIYIYGIIIIFFIIYNLFFRLEDERMDTVVYILFVSCIVLYTGFMAFVLLRKIKNNTYK